MNNVNFKNFCLGTTSGWAKCLGFPWAASNKSQEENTVPWGACAGAEIPPTGNVLRSELENHNF